MNPSSPISSDKKNKKRGNIEISRNINLYFFDKFENKNIIGIK